MSLTLLLYLDGKLCSAKMFLWCRSSFLVGTRRFIARCLESILANDYPIELLEILVVDGRSNDWQHVP